MPKASQENLFSDYAKRASQVRSESPKPVNKRGRVFLVVGGASFWMCLIIFRLYNLQIAEKSTWSSAASRQHQSTFKLAAERGPILDRTGKLLATSVPGGSVFVRPKQVIDKVRTAKVLSETLGIPSSEVQNKLESPSPFVWIARQLPRPLADQIEREDLPGVGLLLESRRYYPLGSSASVLVGKVGIDGQGLSGIEARYEDYLHESPSVTPVMRDGVGNLLHVSTGRQDLPKGRPLYLTLDSSIQIIMDEELNRGRTEAKAESAMAVMVNSRTGEVLGMSQSPSPNFNFDKVSSRQALRNTVVESAFEPGSVLKPIVAALAIESEVTNFHELIDCENGAYRFGGHTINDVHPQKILSTYDVVVHSSNIGMTKLGARLGKDRIYEGLTRFGFGQSTGLGFVGEASGLLRHPSKWYPIDVATHSFGQGVAVTPLQIVRAVSAIANGGVLPELHIIDNGKERLGTRIISNSIATQARRMMEGVVEEEGGTGSRAQIPGVIVGGKTGTAQRPNEGRRGYEAGAYIASFVGYADGTAIGIQDPFTLLVVMDKPRAGSIYGGTVSAPVFQKIMQRTLHYLSTQYGAGSRVESDGEFLNRMPNGNDFQFSKPGDTMFHLASYSGE